ncbi:MAG: hypothetical protein CMJ31_04890 [Phycisphaerae bacterium]|nr:hypothetical protein [Phycisphaerae bacterium]
MTDTSADRDHGRPRRAIRASKGGVRLLAVAALIGWIGTPALAQQPARLTPSVITSPSISATDAEAVAAFGKARGDALLAASADEAGSVINSILNPLETTGVSVRFRQLYGDALDPAIRELLDDRETTWRRLTGLRLAARLATEKSVRIIEDRLDDQRVEDRFFAAFGVELIFESARRSTPAISPARLQRLVDELAAGVEDERNHLLAGVRARALASAGRVPDSAVAGLGEYARVRLANAIAARVRDLPTDRGAAGDLELRTCLQAADSLRNALVDPGLTPTEEFSRAAAGLAGDMIDHVLDRMQANIAGAGDSASMDAKLVGIAGQLAVFADEKLAQATRGQPRLPEVVRDLKAPFESGRLGEFRNAAATLLDALVRSPFNLDDNRFR